MATALETLIDAYIKRNGNQEITGPILNAVLKAIADALATPFIGDDGYWYVYDADTGDFVRTDAPATGPQGPQGPTGPQGPQGPIGPEGSPGITSASVSVDANTGIPSVAASIVNKVLTLAFHNLKGETGAPGTPGAAAGFGTPSATVDANTGTPSVQVAASGPDTAKVFAFTFKNLKGAQGNPGTPGTAAGFGTPTATVDANTGTPAVTVNASGPDTAKVFNFAFRNLKGAQGSPGTPGTPGAPGAAAGFGTPTASVDANTGTPSVVVTPSGPDTAKVFDFAFHNLKGETGPTGPTGPQGPQGPQGNPGSSQDYPFTLANNLTTDDPTVALTAAQGVVLQGEVDQLEAKVDYINLDLDEIPGYISGTGGIAGPSSTYLEVFTRKINAVYGQTFLVKLTHPAIKSMWLALALYDANGDFITRQTWQENATTIEKGITIGNVSAAFARLSYRTFGDYTIVVKTDKDSFIKESISELNDDVSCLTKIIEGAKSGKWSVRSDGYFGNHFILDADANCVAVALFELKKGDILIINDPSACKMHIWWKKASDGTFSYRTWTNAPYQVTVDGIYAVTLEGTPAAPVSDVSELTKYFSFERAVSQVEYNRELHDTVKSLQDSTDISLRYQMIPSVPSGNLRYCDYDTTANTFTIPADTVLLGNYIGTSANYKVLTETVIDLSSVASTALSIVFNKKTSAFSVIPYNNTSISEDCVLFATIRRKVDGLTRYFPNVSCLHPWSVDGNPFGIVIPNYPVVRGFVKGINHRGYNSVAPENTIPAFKLSAEHSFKYVECDVRFTSDGVPVILHDASINRTARNADGTEIATTINIADITYEQALTYDFGIWKDAAYAGTKIPTFEQLLSLCRNLGLNVYIELKEGTQAQMENLVKIVRQYGMDNNVSWISLTIPLLTYIKEASPKARLGYLGNPTASIMPTIEGLKTQDNEVFFSSYAYGQTEIELCKSAGFPLEVWTINSQSTILTLDPYISGVTSDSQDASVLLYSASI